MKTRKYLIALSSFVVLAAGWELAAKMGLYNTFLLPPPSQTFAALLRLSSSGVLYSDLLESGARYIPGYVIGCSLGILAGLVSGTSKRASIAVNPLFHFLRSIPPVALVPFALVLFGIGDAGKIYLVAWACFFPVWLNTHSGIQQVPIEYLRAAKIFRMSELQRIINVWIPSSLPYIINGLRVSIATGFFALVAAEMFAASSGIGFRIIYSYQLFNTANMVAMILLLGLIALLADQGLAAMRRLFVPWEDSK